MVINSQTDQDYITNEGSQYFQVVVESLVTSDGITMNRNKEEFKILARDEQVASVNFKSTVKERWIAGSGYANITKLWRVEK